MTRAADRDEQAQIRALREAAHESAREAGDTVFALAGKLTEAGHPKQLARRGAAAGRQRAAALVPARRRPAVAGSLAGAILLVTAVLIVRRVHGAPPSHRARLPHGRGGSGAVCRAAVFALSSAV